MTERKPAPLPGTSAEDVAEAIEFSKLLTEFGRLLATEYDRRMPLNRGQSAVLSLLMETDGRTVTELADEMGMHKVSVGAHVDELERQGLVARKPHPGDRRSKQVWLTPHFHAVRFIGENVFTTIHARALEGIDRADYRRAVGVMRRMRDNLRALSGET